MGGFWAIELLFFLTVTCAQVQVLTNDNFDTFITENELVLIEFYAPWCGHCKRLEPEYDQAAQELEGVGPLLGKVDCTTEKELGERFEVQGFPTLKLFRSGVPSAYEGGRTAKDIVTYLKKQAGPAIKQLASAEDLQSFIPEDESADAVVVGFAAADSELAKFITQYASKFRDDFRFGLVTSAEVAGDNAFGTITLFKAYDELKNVFSGDLTDEALTTFLKGNSMRAVAEIGPGNYGAYVKRGLPISWLFIDPEATETTEAAISEYRKVASEFKDKLSLVYLNGVQYKQMAGKMGLSGDVLPSLSIDADGVHYVFPEGDAIKESALREWFEKWAKGDLPATVKSEPIPESLFDENNVATVVGDNFKEVVMDDTKDVLIEFYAPWCGHCKSLVPTWNSLATALKGVPSVVIAKTDATANDYPAGFQVSGFPTIQLVTSKGNNVVKHSGDRSEQGFLQWLKENVATPFEVPDGAAGEDSDDKDEL